MQVFFHGVAGGNFSARRAEPQANVGMSIGFAGLALIALTLESEFPPLAFGPALAGASSWAVGNVLVKRRTDIPIFPLVVWCSLVPPLPALAVSLAVDPVSDLAAAIARASLTSLGAVLNLGVGATTVAYAIWGRLLRQHPTGAIAPFALLAPCTGVVASTLVLGEVFSPLRYTGKVLILVGLPVNLTMGGPIRILRSSRAR